MAVDFWKPEVQQRIDQEPHVKEFLAMFETESSETIKKYLKESGHSNDMVVELWFGALGKPTSKAVLIEWQQDADFAKWIHDVMCENQDGLREIRKASGS